MLPVGRHQIPGSAIWVEIADPFADELENLDLGDSYDGEMMTKMFALMAFGVQKEPPTLYRFSTEEDVTVAYAVIEDTSMPHPNWDSFTYENMVYIRLFGVVRAFQRSRTGPSGPTYSMEVLRGILELIVPEATTPVAVALTVRQGNAKARDLYERMGFVEDEAGPFFEDKDWWLALRKPLR